MTAPEDDKAARKQTWVLRLMLVAVSLALGAILLPFWGTLLWGVILALLFTPLYRLLLRRMPARRTLAALLTVLAALLIAVLPFAFLTASLAREAAGVYGQLQSGDLNPGGYLEGLFNAMPQWLAGLLERFGLVGFDDLQRRLASLIGEGSQFIATQAFSIGQNTFEFVASLFVMLYLSFFLIRDGDSLVMSLRKAVPLTAHNQQQLLEKFATVIRATVKGNLLVAVVQGTLGGLAFWFLGVAAPLLWGVLMAFLSLLPAVGAALVWGPVALYFLATGAVWQGVALTGYGVLVIGLVDNVLRPILVGKDTSLPDYVVLITTLGGMAVFGISGFVVGPVIAAMFFAVWHIVLIGRDTS